MKYLLIAFLIVSCNSYNQVEQIINPVTPISEVLSNPGKNNKAWIEGEVVKVVNIPFVTCRFSVRDTSETIWVRTRRSILPNKGAMVKIEIEPIEVANINGERYIECREIVDSKMQQTGKK